jgi:hypothetical protein
MFINSLNLNTAFVYLLVLLADSISYLFLLLKIYRVLCFGKLTMDQLPLLNPYIWPFSLIRIITKPYFKFWSLLLPNVNFGSASYDISAIIGLEVLSKFISNILYFRAFCLEFAKQLAYKQLN